MRARLSGLPSAKPLVGASLGLGAGIPKALGSNNLEDLPTELTTSCPARLPSFGIDFNGILQRLREVLG